MKNRVAKIRKILEPDQLHYVKSADNPADAASRGLLPDKFINCDIWFNGPSWMKDDELPKIPFSSVEVNAFATVQIEPEYNFIEQRLEYFVDTILARST